MFSKLSPFLSFPGQQTNTPNDTPSFAGIPLVNPLLNDAETNIQALDERISQLESVSQWLNMNLQMVNGSIQQLQVQKQTLQALAEWRKLSQTAMDELVKINPFLPSSESEPNTPTNHSNAEESETQEKSSKTDTSESKAVDNTTEPEASNMPLAFEKMAQSWWEGLQQQFSQLAQPIIQNNDTTQETSHSQQPAPSKIKRTSRKSPAKTQKPSIGV